MKNPFEDKITPLTEAEEAEINAWFEANPMPELTEEQKLESARRNMAWLVRIRAMLKAKSAQGN